MHPVKRLAMPPVRVLALMMASAALLNACGYGKAPKPPPAMEMTTALEGTRWRLVQVAGKPVAHVTGQREAYLQLDPSLKRVNASGGCNGFNGTYTLDGQQLSFGAVAGTRMACPKVMEQENAFSDALTRTTQWKVSNARLELLDASGALLAQFVAQ